MFFKAVVASSVCETRTFAAFPASAEPKTSVTFSPASAVYSDRSCIASAVEWPCAMYSGNVTPAASLKASNAVEPFLVSSFSIPLMYVVASAVAIPFLVKATY